MLALSVVNCWLACLSQSVVDCWLACLSRSVVDCWLEPQLSQSKNYKIDICCFSAKYTAFGRKSRLVGLAAG